MNSLRFTYLILCTSWLLLTCKTIKSGHVGSESDPFSVSTLSAWQALERSEANILALGDSGNSPELKQEIENFDSLLLKLKLEGQYSMREYLDQSKESQGTDPNTQGLVNFASQYSSDALDELKRGGLPESETDGGPRLCKVLAEANSQGSFHQIFLTTYYWGYNAGVAKNGGGRWLGYDFANRAFYTLDTRTMMMDTGGYLGAGGGLSLAVLGSYFQPTKMRLQEVLPEEKITAEIKAQPNRFGKPCAIAAENCRLAFAGGGELPNPCVTQGMNAPQCRALSIAAIFAQPFVGLHGTLPVGELGGVVSGLGNFKVDLHGSASFYIGLPRVFPELLSAHIDRSLSPNTLVPASNGLMSVPVIGTLLKLSPTINRQAGALWSLSESVIAGGKMPGDQALSVLGSINTMGLAIGVKGSIEVPDGSRLNQFNDMVWRSNALAQLKSFFKIPSFAFGLQRTYVPTENNYAGLWNPRIWRNKAHEKGRAPAAWWNKIKSWDSKAMGVRLDGDSTLRQIIPASTMVTFDDDVTMMKHFVVSLQPWMLELYLNWRVSRLAEGAVQFLGKACVDTSKN